MYGKLIINNSIYFEITYFNSIYCTWLYFMTPTLSWVEQHSASLLHSDIHHKVQVGWSRIVLHSSTRAHTCEIKWSSTMLQGSTSTQVRWSSILLHSSLHVSAQFSLLKEQLKLYYLADLIFNYMSKLMIFRLIYSCIHLHIFTYI